MIVRAVATNIFLSRRQKNILLSFNDGLKPLQSPSSRNRLQLTDFTGQVGVVRHPFADHSDNRGSIDQVSDTSASLFCADRTVIGEQRKTKVEFCCEFVVGLQSICTYAQNLGVKLCKVTNITLKSLHFDGSARSEVFGVEGQYHRPLLNQLTKHDLAFCGWRTEVGCLIADLESDFLVSFFHETSFLVIRKYSRTSPKTKLSDKV